MPLRILHLFAGPFPTVQGTQVLVGQTCDLLSQSGHDVHLLCYAHEGSKREHEYAIHRIPDIPRFNSERSGPHWKKGFLDLSLAIHCRRLCRKIRPDIVHAHHYEALLAARMTDPLNSRPLVFHLHALMEPELRTYLESSLAPAANFVGNTLDRFIPHLANRVITVNAWVRSHLISLGFDPDDVVTANPPADVPKNVRTRHSGHSNRRLTAVYVGNTDNYQGLDELLAAMGMLEPETRARLQLELVISGDTIRISNKVAAQGLADLVRVVEHGSFEDAWGRTTSADFAIVPRHSPGGIPIKLINALAASLPVLADRRIAVDLFDGEEALLVDMSDPPSVSRGIERMITDDLLRKRLSVGALRAVKRLYSKESYLANIENVYTELPRPRRVRHI